jgi:hypothetical protein
MREASSLTTLGSKPLIVVTADEGVTDGQWQSKQDHMATLSTNSLDRHANATHESLLDDEADSAAASEAIRDVVNAVRTSRPLAWTVAEWADWPDGSRGAELVCGRAGGGGVIQAAVAVAMFVGYRRSGP